MRIYSPSHSGHAGAAPLELKRGSGAIERRHAVRICRNDDLPEDVPTNDRAPMTIPTMKLFHRVPADMVGNANAEMISHAPTAVLMKRNPVRPG